MDLEEFKTKEDAPRVIYLQWKGDDNEFVEVTWSSDKIYKHDLRYIIDQRHNASLKARK